VCLSLCPRHWQLDDANAVKLPDDYCGDCYGANSDIFKCCNNCNELQAAYNAKGEGG
jgi:hypothetical protein